MKPEVLDAFVTGCVVGSLVTAIALVLLALWLR